MLGLDERVCPPMTTSSAPWPSPPASLHWRLIWGVAALQAALQLGWIAYRAFQPALLRDHGFSDLLLPFALLPGFLGLLIEPLSGALSDWRAERTHERLLPITVAVLVAGLLFVTAVTLLGSGQLSQAGILLPALMVAWLVAVQASSSPSLALLQQAASLQLLPRATALLALVQGLIGASSGVLAEAALRFGASGTFLLGALVLGLGLVVLRTLPRPAPAAASSISAPPQSPPPPVERCVRLLVTALAAGVVLQVLLDGLPRVQPLGSAPVVQLCSALVAIVAGRWVSRWGRRQAFLASLAALTVLLALALVLPAGWIPVLLPLLGCLHAIVLISLTAIALASLPPAWSGLGAGLVLGGTGVSASVLALGFGTSGPLVAPPQLAVLVVSGAVALAACWGLRSASLTAR